MASFFVLTPRLRNGREDHDNAVFVRDGFAWLAFILPIPWLLVQRLWFEAALVLAATVALSIVGAATGHGDMAAMVTALLSLLVGLEGNNWRAARLERKEFEHGVVVTADNAIDAETAYFYRNDLSAKLSGAPQTTAPSRSAGQKPLTGGMVGLVSHRGEN